MPEKILRVCYNYGLHQYLHQAQLYLVSILTGSPLNFSKFRNLECALEDPKKGPPSPEPTFHEALPAQSTELRAVPGHLQAISYGLSGQKNKRQRIPSKQEGHKEGSGTSSRAESKNCVPQRPLGSPPFTAFNPGSPKWGKAEAEEGCYQAPGFGCCPRGGRAPTTA